VKQKNHVKVSSRKEQFTDKVATRIWYEEASADNPYLEEKSYCHGYDLLELTRHCSYVDVFYLLFRGELPTEQERRVLEALMVAYINPGPRHPASRAAMTAGVGKTDPAHILPISQIVLGGAFAGAGEVEVAMRFLQKKCRKDPVELSGELLQQEIKSNEEGDIHIAPGFGSHYGGIDSLARQRAEYLLSLVESSHVLRWGHSFALALEPHGMGWLNIGVVAAVLAELGFTPRAGAGLYQIISAPGLLAHGIELANKPITAMPFVDDQHYVIEKN